MQDTVPNLVVVEKWVWQDRTPTMRSPFVDTLKVRLFVIIYKFPMGRETATVKPRNVPSSKCQVPSKASMWNGAVTKKAIRCSLKDTRQTLPSGIFSVFQRTNMVQLPFAVGVHTFLQRCIQITADDTIWITQIDVSFVKTHCRMQKEQVDVLQGTSFNTSTVSLCPL